MSYYLEHDIGDKCDYLIRLADDQYIVLAQRCHIEDYWVHWWVHWGDDNRTDRLLKCAPEISEEEAVMILFQYGE